MATQYKTIGAAGDYADPKTAYNALVALGAWADDYEFNLISSVNCTEWPTTASRVIQNGHSVKFTCSHNKAIPDKPQNWYTVTMSGTSGFFRYIHDAGCTVADVTDLEYWHIIHASNTAVNLIGMRQWVLGGGDTHTHSIKNCFIRGYGAGSDTAIAEASNEQYYTIENVVCYNVYNGLKLVPSGYNNAYNFPGRKNVNNCTIFVTGEGRGVDIINCPGNNITLKNVFVFGSTTGDDWFQSNNGTALADRVQLFNCADSDNTIATNMITSATTTDCVPNVVALDNLQSVNSADLGDGFLELIDGGNNSGKYGPGAVDLGHAGLDAVITMDIYGRGVPGSGGYYSIGAFQQQYVIVLDVMILLNTPQHDYVSEIPIGLLHTALEPRGYGIWDNGSANDHARMCRATWLMNEANADTLLDIINNTGRGNNIILRLGTKSGFFPFGPDFGDSGDFTIRVISATPGPVQSDPWLYFSVTLEFVMVSGPEYVLPSQVDEGNLQIGTITGLRYPPDFPASSTNYNFSTQLTRAGTPYTIDKLMDAYVTKLAMVLRHNKAAALINHLMVTVRNNDLNVIAQGNNYIFGRENNSSGKYVCQWLNESITVTHVRYDQFNFDLTFSYRSSSSSSSQSSSSSSSSSG